MSKTDRQKKRQNRQRHGKPSAPRVIGANDNHPSAANDDKPVVVGGVTLNRADGVTFRKAEQDLASFEMDEEGHPRVIRNAKNELVPVPDIIRRREGQQAMLQIEAALRKTLDDRHMKAVRDEIDALERTRGGALTVERARDKRGEDGEILKVGRDGLSSLATKRLDPVTKERTAALTDVQYSAGLRYRADYERVDPERMLTPPTLLREGKTKGGGGEGFDTKIRESWTRIRTVHLMIAGLPLEIAQKVDGAAHERPNMPRLPAGHPAMRAIHALDQIAGKGRSVSEMSDSGSVKARIRDDLIFALDACEIVYGLG